MMGWLLGILWDYRIDCVFYQVTGAFCPGCGGTRATLFLLSGDLGRSFQYHPLILYSIAAMVLYTMVFLVSRKKTSWKFLRSRHLVLIYLGVVIILGNWIYKNYMLLVNGINLLP